MQAISLQSGELLVSQMRLLSIELISITVLLLKYRYVWAGLNFIYSFHRFCISSGCPGLPDQVLNLSSLYSIVFGKLL
jgi:hypothetical protein